MTIRELIRENKIIHTVVSGIYRNTLYLLKTGYTKGSLEYQLFTKKNEFIKLKTAGFTNISIFKKRSWKFGGGYDHAYRRYYSADFDTKRVFIKVAKNDSTILNEIDLGKHLKPYHFPFVCEEEYSDKDFDQGTLMLASDFISDLSPFVIPDTYEAFILLCMDFLVILKQLETSGVVHADIHRNNLMMRKSGELVLLDFGISRILDKSNSVDYIARPGTYFQLVEKAGKTYRIYDDAYSFTCLVDSIGIPDDWKAAEEYKNITDRIGHMQFTVEC